MPFTDANSWLAAVELFCFALFLLRLSAPDWIKGSSAGKKKKMKTSSLILFGTEQAFICSSDPPKIGRGLALASWLLSQSLHNLCCSCMRDDLTHLFSFLCR